MLFLSLAHSTSKCPSFHLYFTQAIGLNDILVTTGIIMQESVDQDLRDRHYWCGVCCILLWREILIQKSHFQILQYEDLPAAVQHSLVHIVRNALTATQVTLPEANSCLGHDVYGPFLDHVPGDASPLMRFLAACHERSFNEYLSWTHSLLPGLTAYDKIMGGGF